MTRAIAETEAKASAMNTIYRYLEDEENVKALLDTLYMYIRQLGVVQGDNVVVQKMAEELLGDVVIQILTNSERYDSSRKLRPWLNGIALNIVRRKKDEQIKRYQRELSFSHVQHTQNVLSDNAFFEQFVTRTEAGPEQSVEAMEQFEALLSLMTESDQQILRLYILHDFNAVQIASKLGITHQAARQRISRMRKQLRTILERQGGKPNE